MLFPSSAIKKMFKKGDVEGLIRVLVTNVLKTGSEKISITCNVLRALNFLKTEGMINDENLKNLVVQSLKDKGKIVDPKKVEVVVRFLMNGDILKEGENGYTWAIDTGLNLMRDIIREDPKIDFDNLLF